MLAGDFVRAAPFETVRTKDIELRIFRFENGGPFPPNVPIIPAKVTISTVSIRICGSVRVPSSGNEIKAAQLPCESSCYIFIYKNRQREGNGLFSTYCVQTPHFK